MYDIMIQLMTRCSGTLTSAPTIICPLFSALYFQYRVLNEIMNSTQPTPESPEIDTCTLGLSILGIVGTICAILQLTLAYIRKTCLCVPENTWYLHFLLLTGILGLFVASCIPDIFGHYLVCFTQFPPTICVCCILTLATNLFFLYIYRQSFSSTFLLILPILLAFPVVLILLYVYKSNYTHETLHYVNYNYIQYALSSICLYLDYLLTISMLLTLCLYKTLYGKLLCLTTWTSWILWNISWSIYSYIFLVIPYFCLTFGYILLLFYIYPILISKYFHTLPRMTTQRGCAAPPRLQPRTIKKQT
nr:G protein-coupled receptor 8D [Elephant endotheliotropic herpesvirus 1A]